MPSALVSIIVSHDPIEALVIARNLAREGLDSSELHEAAMDALAPKQQPKEAPQNGNHPRNPRPDH